MNEKPKNQVLEEYNQALEKLDKIVKELTDWIIGGEKKDGDI